LLKEVRKITAKDKLPDDTNRKNNFLVSEEEEGEEEIFLKQR